MSHRITIFRTAYAAPELKAYFWVYIPHMELSMVLAESTTLPFPSYTVLQTHERGATKSFPGNCKSGGEWECTSPEDILSSNLFIALTALVVNQNRSGSKFQKYDVLVAPTLGSLDAPLPHTLYKLEGCWIQTLNPLVLDHSSGDVQKFTVKFKYDNVVNITLKAGGADGFNLK